MGLVMGRSVLCLPLWVKISARMEKHRAYGYALVLWLIAQAGVFYIPLGHSFRP
jgi:Na+/melibiose symporter-like transporter